MERRMADEYICITQGSAGVLERGETVGLFSEKIESCRVSVFECENATLMVHDTGQINLEELYNFLSSYGEIKAVQYAVGALTAESHHSARFKLLAKRLKFRPANATAIRIPQSSFSVAYAKDIGLVEADSRYFKLRRDPNETVCESVNVLNDWYTPSNSQSVPLNIQYREGEFTPPPTPKLTVPQMLRDLRADKKNGLLGASALGYYGPRAAINVPPELQAFLVKVGLAEAYHRGLPLNIKSNVQAYQQVAAEFAKLPIFG